MTLIKYDPCGMVNNEQESVMKIVRKKTEGGVAEKRFDSNLQIKGYNSGRKGLTMTPINYNPRQMAITVSEKLNENRTKAEEVIDDTRLEYRFTD